MNNQSLLKIDAKYETTRITSFLQTVFAQTRQNNAVIGWSGGIDSTVSLYLLARAIDPKRIFAYHLPYEKTYWNELVAIANKLSIPKTNIRQITIKKNVDHIKTALKTDEKTRSGNIMARLRMIVLFDQAKQHSALVCGTENKTEHLLGYFTRYGDGASDIEPIVHLYKTQIYQLGTFLKIENTIQKRVPTADLWEGQTDENDFGFTYKEADEVLFRYLDLSQKKKDKSFILNLILNEGFKNTKKIIDRFTSNKFKNEVPYSL